MKKEKNPTNINKEGTVKQSNNLTVARYTLSLLEQRLMFAICSQIDKNSDSFSKVRFGIDQLADLCSVDGKRKYDDIRNTSNKLMKRIVNIPTYDGGEYTTHWLQSRRYYPEDCSIEFKIDEDLKGELLQLKKAYIDTPVKMLTGFKKKYTSRMYLILKKMLKIGDFEYTLDFFRETFQLADTYKKFSNIKNGVLEPALIELNESSDIEVIHEYIKEGRFFTKIHFTVKLKEKREQKETSASISSPSKEETEIIGKLAKYEIGLRTAKKLMKEFKMERIKKNIKFAYDHRAGKINMGGWVIDCIRNDRASDAEQAKEIAKKEDEAKQNDILRRLKPLPKITNDLPEDSLFHDVLARVKNFEKGE